ncbi:arsenate reductase/protein-tyrosine-phosphatase family protein [Mycobacteroides abscessus]|uniref:arsenate reductase/protein-tyrosine-phosphatase family protein n=1 Tax=Mycobacteroides abscessus TaxID=36809 RepID=UPI0009285FD2|nr:arsenate reductase ArsC [Mycobacteroides abscessus]SHP27381.1 Putative arsenate reductase or tyrosine phosphatase [Mycobacteroides abscessus subsp. bolletii]SHR52724.1 Putative arsenate reductase or tyrosine phosphatase [Mycobacteroides abscessus subsp. bolletii]SHS31467.1 Putative arsenate reductase or tyrosine phosphatase [Mycobacteroides abscessus subsp. bolletii]SKF72140.1 Putative arsenate reductase or tyrosine phosphatase [Mycobacteroides abscessus subsp. bolletii]SKF90196.1 Putative 
MTDKPTVLFLCTHNAGRSQMALGYFTNLARGNAVGMSGGSEPADQINPAAIEVMHEVGIDITAEYPKPWSVETVRAADVVVTMGCGDSCPYFPGKRYENWEPARPSETLPTQPAPTSSSASPPWALSAVLRACS